MREGGRPVSVSVSLRPITIPILLRAERLGGDSRRHINAACFVPCMHACLPEALFWRSGRINGERERDLLCDADDKRDKGGDEGREAEGGGLIKSKARQGGARRSLARRRPRNWRPAYHHHRPAAGAAPFLQPKESSLPSDRFSSPSKKGLLAGDEG